MDKNQFLSLAAGILEVDADDISLDSDLDVIDWDSLANISFIAEVDSRLGKRINPEALNKCASLSDIFSLISTKD